MNKVEAAIKTIIEFIRNEGKPTYKAKPRNMAKEKKPKEEVKNKKPNKPNED